MKPLRLLTFPLVVHALACSLAAQTSNVLKDKNNRLIDSLKVPSGKTFTIESGATINATGATITGFTASAAWADITGTPATVTALGNLSNAAGILTNNGSGTLSYTGTSADGGIFDSGKAVLYRSSGGIRAGSFQLGTNTIANPLAAGLTWTMPTTNGSIVCTGDSGSITNAMLAGSIALSKLATTGTASSSTYLRGDGAWTSISSGATLAANTFTALQQFSGTDHAGLRLNNLTTTQRDALTGSAGMVIWNTTDGRMQLHNGTAWTSGMVRLSGDTMTGALGITGGTVTASTPPINITQTWNNAAITFRGIEYAVSNTTSNAASSLIRLLGGASGTTQAFAITASTGSASIGASNNSATITLQGSDRSAVASIGAFGSEFRFTNIQLGTANASLRFTDANAVTRYATLYGQDTDVLALRNGSGSTTGAAWEMLEMTAPGTPAADRIRLYVEDNGSGKTRLVVKWSDGTTSVLATQP